MVDGRVLRRRSYPVLMGLVIAIMAILAIPATLSLRDEVSGGALIGFAGIFGTTALSRRIFRTRVILGQDALRIVNPVLTYEVPYRSIVSVESDLHGNLRVVTGDGDLLATAFGGSLIDHLVGSTDRAAMEIEPFIGGRRARPPQHSVRRSYSVSWFADACALASLSCVVAGGILGF